MSRLGEGVRAPLRLQDTPFFPSPVFEIQRMGEGCSRRSCLFGQFNPFCRGGIQGFLSGFLPGEGFL